MSQLGRMGRWGNQVFQYMFLRTYGRRYNLSYQCPQWEGQRLFGFNDPPLSRLSLPVCHEQRDETIKHTSSTNYQSAWRVPMIPTGSSVVGHDFHGYCQFHTSYYAPDKQFIQELFTPTHEVQSRIEPALQELRDNSPTLVGLHMRRGDTGRAIFYLTPNEWYLAWLAEHWNNFVNPRLFIATEEPSDVYAFEKYNPITSHDLLILKEERYQLYNYLRYDLANPTSTSMDWFPDWYLLSQCDVMLFGESTFSFSAAMLNKNLAECWQSRLSTQAFERIDPWNIQPLMREHLDDYPGIPGTCVESNPQWRGGEVVPTPK